MAQSASPTPARPKATAQLQPPTVAKSHSTTPPIQLSFTISPTSEKTKDSTVAEIATAFSPIVWALVVLIISIVYKSEVRGVLKRLRELKIFGQEAKLDKDLDELERIVESQGAEPPGSFEDELAMDDEDAGAPISITRNRGSAASVERDAPSEAVHRDSHAISPGGSPDSAIDDVLRDAAISPRVGLISLAGKLEQRVKRLIGRRDSNFQMSKMLRSVPGFSSSMVEAFRIFWRIRSRLVHGEDVSDHEIIRAIDSGINLYRVVSSLLPLATVINSNQPFYRDRDLTEVVEGVTGVTLSYSAGWGTDSEQLVEETWPTDHAYRVGQMVTFEWDTNRRQDGLWLRDQSGRAIQPWISAAYFVGTPLTP